MTKPYHLTQEQASSLLDDLHTTGLIASNSLDTDDFAIAVNAALDKVLGEPEIYMAKSLENGTYATHPRKSECELFLAQSKLKNDGKQATVLTLYAPKGLT